MTASPFKFLDSYERADIGSFFGRERETDELFRLCFVSPMLVVYGGSGTGKTSLIQCGLAARFEESDWLPVPVRRQGDMIASLREAVRAATLTPSPAQDLGELTANLYLDHFKPIWFLFDQFEELFIFGGHAESTAFFTALNGLLEREKNARAILIVREEYLAELTRYERIVPGLIENRYRVERLSHLHAGAVVDKLCAAHNIPCSGDFSSALVERLDPGGQGIELSYLQVFLDRCWRTRQGDEPFSPALLERIGHVDDLLGAFLDEQVAATPEPRRAEALLKTFVSDQGTKRQLTTDEAHEWVNTIGTTMDLAETERTIQELVSKRLLKDRDEHGRYELLHDALARQIFQRITRAEQELIEVRQFVEQAHGQYRKRGVKLTPNDLAYLRPYRGQLHLKGEVKDFVEGAFREEERKERRRKLFRWAGAALLLATLIGTGLYAYNLNRQLQAEKLVKQSIALAEEAMKVLSGDPFSAYLLAEEAYRISPTFESEKALVNIYPFLYPEKARYRGNGVFQMPMSDALLIVDQARNNARLYSMAGKLKWSRDIPTANSYGGVYAFDSSGVLLFKGDSTHVLSTSGDILYSGMKPYADFDFMRDQACCFTSGRDLLLIRPGSPLSIFPLDTAGIHHCLMEATYYRDISIDESFKYLMVRTGQHVRMFDLRSDNLRLLDDWVAPEPLVKEATSTGRPGEFIAFSKKMLYHLQLDGRTLRVAFEYDYAADGHSSKEIQIGGLSGNVVFSGPVQHAYSAKQMRTVRLPQVEQPYEVRSVDFDRDQMLVWIPTGNGNDLKGAFVLTRIEGRSDMTICSGCGPYDVQLWGGICRYISTTPGASPGLSRSSWTTLDGSEAVVVEWPLDSMVSDLEFDQARGRLLSIPLSSSVNESPRWPNYTFNIAAFDGAKIQTMIAANGWAQHILTPRMENGGGRLMQVMDSVSGTVFVIYADSLISELVVAPFDKARQPVAESFACSRDSDFVSVSLKEGRAFCHRFNHELRDDTFSVDLHGCLDTLDLVSYEYRGAMALTKRWASAHTWTNGSPVGQFLVDLENRRLLDTGLFAHPARYELLPEDDGLVRIGDGQAIFLNADLKRTVFITGIPVKTGGYSRSGDVLFFTDSIRHGTIGILDLRDKKLRKRSFPVDALDTATQEHLEDVRQLAIDPFGHLYIVVPQGHLFSRLYVFHPDDSYDILDVPGHRLFIDQKGRNSPTVRVMANLNVMVNGSIMGDAIVDRYVVYSADQGTFETTTPGDEPVMGYPNGHPAILRGGRQLMNVQDLEPTLCGRYMYSRFRAVDRYERFPLYGADVVKEVREEKKFGPFWEHIDGASLIRKYLKD